MVRYIINRLLSSILILIVITIVAFTIIQIPPGDFAEVYKAELVALGGTSEEQAEEAANRLRDKYGLLDPIPIQYIKWMGAIVLRGDFGWSFSQRVDVSDLLAQRLPRTLWIALSAHAISSLVGILLGIYVANRQYSFADNTAAAFAFLRDFVPAFFHRANHHVFSGIWAGLGTRQRHALAGVSLCALVDRQGDRSAQARRPGDFDRRLGWRGAQPARDARQLAGCAESAVCDDGALQGIA